MKKTLHIENLDCPVCAEALQSDLGKLKGVQAVVVDYVSQTIALEYTDAAALARVIKTANKFEEVRVLDGNAPTARNKTSHFKEWLLIGVAAALLLCGALFERLTSGFAFELTAYTLYAIAYLSVGYPVLLSTCKNVAKGRIFDENFLMTIASIGAAVLGEFGEAVLVMLLYQLGELLQSIAVGSSRSSVAELMELKSEHATVLADGRQQVVSPEALKVGDTVLVKAGEKVPADGMLLSETATLDTKSLTGEAELKQAKTGEEILSGCINAGGVCEIRIVRPYEESAVGKILDLVENASAGKAAPEKFIAKFARVYTPVVCLLAVALALFAPLLGGLIVDGRLYFRNFDRWLQSALTFLVISCPCALVISVPLTYFSGIGVCAKKGVLVKGGTYLDVLATAKTVAFDKTGTLTEGNFAIRKISPVPITTETELLSVIAAAERGSSHPIAQAFSQIDTPYVADNVTERAGLGLTAEISGERILVGNAALLAEHGIAVNVLESVDTCVYAARNGEYLGSVEIGDELRGEARETVGKLKELGFVRSVMLTGDRRDRAEAIAAKTGVDEVYAELLPDGKLEKAQALKESGGLVYVGDGVNDAPVMVAADCAVSMGKLGSAAAIEASDVVLVSDNLQGLSYGVKTARKTRRVVLQNILFSIVMKVGFMALGASGLLPLWLAVFADVGVMLLAVLNSFRVRIG